MAYQVFDLLHFQKVWLYNTLMHRFVWKIIYLSIICIYSSSTYVILYVIFWQISMVLEDSVAIVYWSLILRLKWNVVKPVRNNTQSPRRVVKKLCLLYVLSYLVLCNVSLQIQPWPFVSFRFNSLDNLVCSFQRVKDI